MSVTRSASFVAASVPRYRRSLTANYRRPRMVRRTGKAQVPGVAAPGGRGQEQRSPLTGRELADHRTQGRRKVLDMVGFHIPDGTLDVSPAQRAVDNDERIAGVASRDSPFRFHPSAAGCPTTAPPAWTRPRPGPRIGMAGDDRSGTGGGREAGRAVLPRWPRSAWPSQCTAPAARRRRVRESPTRPLVRSTRWHRPAAHRPQTEPNPLRRRWKRYPVPDSRAGTSMSTSGCGWSLRVRHRWGC